MSVLDVFEIVPKFRGCPDLVVRHYDRQRCPVSRYPTRVDPGFSTEMLTYDLKN